MKLAKEVAGDQALVAGSVSRTQLIEREGMESLDKARDHIAEQIRLLKDAGVDFLILETFFHLAEMKVALECAAAAGLPAVATMSFRPLDHAVQRRPHAGRMREASWPISARSPSAPIASRTRSGCCRCSAKCARRRNVPLAAQPAAFRTTDECHSSRGCRRFPTIWKRSRFRGSEFIEFGKVGAQRRNRLRRRLLRLQRRLHQSASREASRGSRRGKRP